MQHFSRKPQGLAGKMSAAGGRAGLLPGLASGGLWFAERW